MVASLLRLLHSGPQDQRLLPKLPKDAIQAYKKVLIRAGRMTTQWQRIDFYREPQLGQQSVVRIPVKGELLTRLYLVVEMPDINTIQELAAATAAAEGKTFLGPRFGWTNSLGHALIQSATLDVAGQRLEQLDGRLLEVLDEFNTPLEKVLTQNSLIKRAQTGFGQSTFGRTTTPTRVCVPLPFWFSRGDLGAALPIDALYVDTVNLTIQFRPVTGVYYTDARSGAVDGTVEGSALWPLLGSSFYVADPAGPLVSGLGPEPVHATRLASPVMPSVLPLGDTYLLAEYVYLDRPEANRFRIAEITIPLVQHYAIDPKDTRGFPRYQIPMEIPNPVRNVFFFCQNYNAPAYNAPFLATRDLSGCDVAVAPWWPDCQGLVASYAGDLVPGFLRRGSEPVASLELLYEGRLVKTSTDNMALYRSVLPSLELRKSPWHNRYMYCVPFGLQQGTYPGTLPMGEANWNRILKKELALWLTPREDGTQERLWIHVWVQTYNVFRLYGGRGTLLFGY